MTFLEGLAKQTMLQSYIDKHSDKLNTYPSGPMGLTTDAAKNTAEWQQDRKAFDLSMGRLRAFNAAFLRQYKVEYRKYMQEKRGY